MDPLSENSNYIDPASVSPRPTGIRYGLIWGLIGIVLGLVSHVMGWGDPANPDPIMGTIIWLVTVIISVVMVVLAIKQHKGELGGYISLGRAFTVGIIATLVSAVIAVVWMMIYTNLIAPDMFVGLEDKMVEQWEEQGLSDEQIEQAKGYTGMFTSPVALTVSAFIMRTIWGAILSLIVGAIMKKDFQYST